MTVASRELRKELYELSDWQNECEGIWPMGYDLSFLLRKLQQFGVSIRANGFGTWEAETDSAELGDEHEQLEQTWNIPEDAVTKLAIELFKDGILPKDKS